MKNQEEIPNGTKLVQKYHPEYGIWVVLRKYDQGIWEIRGNSGDKCLFDTELRFWEEVI